MPKQLFVNNFTSVFVAAVKAAPTTGNPATELDYGVVRLPDTATAGLVAPTGGDYYLMTAFKRSGSVESAYEIMKVTHVDTSVAGECRLTVQRGQEGTSVLPYAAGDYVSARWTAGAAANAVQSADNTVALAAKVDKAAGMGLSSNDFTGAEKTKLAGVAAGATANATDAQLRDRATHTGTQAIATVAGLQGALDAKAPQDLSAASAVTLDGTEELPVSKAGFFKTTVAAVRTWLLGLANTWSAAQTFSVSPQVPTATAGDATTKAASTAFVAAAISAGGGNAATATKLATARSLQTDLASAASASFDGSANATPGVTGVLALANGGTGGNTAANARTGLGLGTAATQNTGTSGANVPLLNAANTWGANQTFSTPTVAKVVHFGAGAYSIGNSGAAVTVNFVNGQKQVMALNSNCTITLTAPGVGNYLLYFYQDATGGRTVTWAVSGGSVLYVGSATAPAINTAANGWTVVSIYWDGANAWIAAAKVNA